jgi:hypothetical protein
MEGLVVEFQVWAQILAVYIMDKEELPVVANYPEWVGVVLFPLGAAEVVFGVVVCPVQGTPVQACLQRLEEPAVQIQEEVEVLDLTEMEAMEQPEPATPVQPQLTQEPGEAELIRVLPEQGAAEEF